MERARTAQIRRDLAFAGGYDLGAPRFSPYQRGELVPTGAIPAFYRALDLRP